MVSEKFIQEIHGDITTHNYDIAIGKLTEALKKEPNNIALILDLAFAYGSVNKFDDAIKLYEKVVKKTPDNESGYTGLGFMYKKKGDNEKAVEMFRKALELRVDNALVYFELGDTLFELEKYDEAIKTLHKAIQFGGPETDPQVLLLIAQCQMGIGTEESLNEAVRNATKVLELNHDYVGAHLVLGTAHFMKKDWKSAIDNLEIYTKFDPEDEAARNLLHEANSNLK